jgi:hypothetical protein
MGRNLMDHQNSVPSPMVQGGTQDVVQAEVNQQLEYLRLRTQKTSEECRRIEQEQEAFALQYHECTKLNGKYFVIYCYA